MFLFIYIVMRLSVFPINAMQLFEKNVGNVRLI